MVEGALQYYSKIIRVMWETKINSINSEACRVVVEQMMALKMHLKELGR